MTDSTPAQVMQNGLLMLWISFKGYKGQIPPSLAAELLKDLTAREKAWKAAQTS